MKQSETIPIARIRLDEGTQPRAALNLSAIDDCAKARSAGAKFPRVIVYHDGEHYGFPDGFHRVKAGCAAGLEVVECDVRQGKSGLRAVLGDSELRKHIGEVESRLQPERITARRAGFTAGGAR